jgi:hypothetical protein
VGSTGPRGETHDILHPRSPPNKFDSLTSSSSPCRRAPICARIVATQMAEAQPAVHALWIQVRRVPPFAFPVILIACAGAADCGRWHHLTLEFRFHRRSMEVPVVVDEQDGALFLRFAAQREECEDSRRTDKVCQKSLIVQRFSNDCICSRSASGSQRRKS